MKTVVSCLGEVRFGAEREENGQEGGIDLIACEDLAHGGLGDVEGHDGVARVDG